MTKPIYFLGYKLYNKSTRTLINDIVKQKNTSRFKRIVTLNPTIFIQSKSNKKLNNWLLNADIITADGKGIYWGLKYLYNKTCKLVTGIDIVLQLIKQKDISLFLIGGSKDVINKTVKNIKNKNPEIKIAGFSNGYFDATKEKEIIKNIIEAKPTIILVGLGFPKQEQFIQSLEKQCKQGVAIGIGGCFDIISGNKKHAPYWIRKIHMEWVYRTLQEPKRVIRWNFLIKYIIYIIRTPKTKEYITYID